MNDETTMSEQQFLASASRRKTAPPALVAKKYSELGHTVLVRSVPALLSDIRGLQAAENEKEWVEMRAQLVELDLLGLDDLGAEVASPWALERLFELINERESRNRALLVTTNFDPQQLKRRLGWRIVVAGSGSATSRWSCRGPITAS